MKMQFINWPIENFLPVMDVKSLAIASIITLHIMSKVALEEVNLICQASERFNQTVLKRR